LRVVRNKKYTEVSKRRADVPASSHNNNVADKVQQVCSMVVTDDFVQAVTVTRDGAPMVVLNNSSQLSDIRAFCLSKRGCVLSVDKTYNLG